MIIRIFRIVCLRLNDSGYPQNSGFQVMRWYENLQFIYVLSGEIEAATLERAVPLHTGGRFFGKINIKNKSLCGCSVTTFVFELKAEADLPAALFIALLKITVVFFNVANSEIYQPPN